MQTSVPKKYIPLIVRLLMGLLLAMIALGGGLFLLVVVWVRTMHQQGFRERLVQFNKQTLNPTTLKIAGRRASMYAALKHVGRRSGRAYTTPVIAKPLGDGFVIPLPYGAGVDWCRNVRTRGTCMLIWNEHDYPMERPELLQPSVALKAFPFFSRLLYTAGGIQQYLWLHQQRTGRVRHREANTLQENNLHRPWLSLAMGPDVINKGEREQHLEPMRPSRTFFSQGKN